MLLQVDQLRTYIDTETGTVKAVDGVSFSVDEGQSLGIVGESGCGKSVTALSLMKLLPSPPVRYVSGSVEFQGQNTLTMENAELRKIRGAKIGMIFQEPMTSLNPVYSVGNQVAEALELHFPKMTPTQIRKKVITLLQDVGIADPDRRVDCYPHELSGGMRQRIVIAMALSCDPQLIIADEPTTALDVTIQAQILDLLKKKQKERGLALILISHDLGVVSQMVDKVLVMYAGEPVEMAPTGVLFGSPMHPYTVGLLKSIPGPENIALTGRKKNRLASIDGGLPDPKNLPLGCLFEPRCGLAVAACGEQRPKLEEKKKAHTVSCFEV